MDDKQEDELEALWVDRDSMPSGNVMVFQKVSENSRVLSQSLATETVARGRQNLEIILDLTHDSSYI